MIRTLAKKISFLTLAGVLFIVQAFPVHASTPNDPDFTKQSYLWRVKAPAAWDLVQKYAQKRDIVIAVLDTGVAIDHPDLKNNIWVNKGEIPGDGIDNDNNSYIDDVNGWDFLTSTPDPRPKLTDNYAFDAVNHGTVVAGVIAAEANNNLGIAGAAYNVKIMPLRVLDSEGSGNTLLLAQAVDYAVENGANVINLSLVGEVNDPQLSASIDAAYRAGVAVVAASGNQEHAGVNLNQSPRYPVCETDALNRVLGVAAVDENDTLADFSNYGSQCIDVSAPGTDFYSTSVHFDQDPAFSNYYSGGWSGTSVAAPLVSSAIALIEEVAPNISLSEVYKLILNNASSLNASNGHPADLGHGMLDMSAALEHAIERSRSNPVVIVMSQGRGFEPRISIRDKNGIITSEFMAYAKSFRGGVNATVGNVSGDSQPEIITAPASSGGPHVRVFDTKGQLKSQFMAYSSKFNGGLSIATGDIDGDGVDEIITAPLQGVKNGPEVHVFNARGDLLYTFYAYAKNFRGGVKLALGDVDGDGIDEIITAPASAGGPHVRIFSRSGQLKGQFMAFNQNYRGGLSLGVGDVDGDGHQDIVAVQETDDDVQVHIFNGQGTEKNRFPVYPEVTSLEQPSDLIVGDYTGDGQADILTYGLSAGSGLKLFDYYGRVIDTINVSGTAPDQSAIKYSFALLH